MGLLDRASSSQSPDNKPDFLSSLMNLERGVDFPVVLFQKIVHRYRVEKGALFFSSSRGFTCLSSRGYDKTTTNRLRLDASASESAEFAEMLSTRGSLKSSGGPTTLKEYMSSREFGLLENIFWLPFFREDSIFCIILISQWGGIEPGNWSVDFNGISANMSEPLFNSRKSLAVEKSEKRPGKNDLVEKLENLEDAFLIEINLAPLIKSIIDIREGLSILNLKNEIHRVFKTLAGPSQDVIELDHERLLLVLDKHRTPDPGLFLHQLSASLPLLFQDLDEPPVLETKKYTPPGSAEELEDLIGIIL